MAAARNSPSTDPLATVAAFFAPRLAGGGRRICVALSGGIDSVALLHALVAAKRGGLPASALTAVHVHHGLSANADAWADFCSDLCRRLDVPLRCERVRVASTGVGIEAAARAARYAVFGDCAADWLALAHHRDDQAETVLLNLLRGAGAHGLAAMPPVRTLAAGAPLLARPLLSLSRQQIAAWAAAEGLAWINDESNEDGRFRRNFLRREIMPRLAQAFPDPAAALFAAAERAADAVLLADEVAVADASATIDDRRGALALSGLLALPPARRANLLRHFLACHGRRMPDARHLAEILRQLDEAAPSAAPAFRVDAAEFRVANGFLWRVPAPVPAPSAAPWPGAAPLAWAGGELRCRLVAAGGFAPHLADVAELVFRPRRGGETLQPDPRRPRRPLKKLLQEAGIPAWRRRQMPVLWHGELVVWAAGIGCDAAFLAADGTPGWLPSWDLPETALCG